MTDPYDNLPQTSEMVSALAREINNIREKMFRQQDAHKQEIARLTAERDEARREICQAKGTMRFAPHYPFATPRQYADIRGWDCYQEATP